MSGPSSPFVGAIDQGTTSTRFLIFNHAGEPVASYQVEFTQFYPHPGWHEQDPLEIVSSVEKCIKGAIDIFKNQHGHSVNQITSLGVTNQRETTLVWNWKTGEPLYNAIVWTDTRTRELVHELKSRPGSKELEDICGEPLSTYPSAPKLLWLLRNVPLVQETYERGELAFGTVDTWLIYKLNGGIAKNVFVSDPTNASRTMFMNIRTLQYDSRLLSFFGLDSSKIHLPKIVKSSQATSFGSICTGPLKGFRITGCLGDQSAALVGQKGFSPGQAKNTYGTGCFLLYNVGDTPVISRHGLLATVAYHFDDKPVYALEGSIAVAGSSVKFIMNNMGFIEASHKISELAQTVEDNGGCVFVTAFSGLFAPYWIDSARGTIFGITPYTQRGHIARATLEATCFQTKAILDAMEADSGKTLAELTVDGGMSNSDLCMQIQADIINIPVKRPQMHETTALGAAIAAGLAVGLWKNLNELKSVNAEGTEIFKPQLPQEDSKQAFELWTKAVQMSKGWVAEKESFS